MVRSFQPNPRYGRLRGLASAANLALPGATFPGGEKSDEPDQHIGAEHAVVPGPGALGILPCKAFLAFHASWCRNATWASRYDHFVDHTSFSMLSSEWRQLKCSGRQRFKMGMVPCDPTE
jgi:hypothetical protein